MRNQTTTWVEIMSRSKEKSVKLKRASKTLFRNLFLANDSKKKYLPVKL